MIEAILTRHNLNLKAKITIKSLISVGVVVLAVLLPQLVHLVEGQSGGLKWLPMYLPVLMGGCLLGWKWGLCVGIMSPLVSFAVTSMMGSAMPALTRLPYIMVELAVFASVTGLFSKLIYKNSWIACPAVLIAAVSGRLVFLLIARIFQNVSSLSASLVWSQIQTGLLGLILQVVLVPLIVMGLSYILKKEKKIKE